MNSFVPNFFNDCLENTSYSFSRPWYERKGWYAIEKEGKTFILVNVLGVAEKDVIVNVDSSIQSGKHLLSVNGKTHNDLIDKDFAIQIKWVTEPLKEVVKSFENGIMTLELEYEKPVKPMVKIINKLELPAP